MAQFNREAFEQAYVDYAILLGFSAMQQVYSSEEGEEPNYRYSMWEFRYEETPRRGYGSLFAAAVEWVRLNGLESTLHDAVEAIDAGAATELQSFLNHNRYAESKWAKNVFSQEGKPSKK